MFDISWSELLILAVVTLVFIKPKDLPMFMRTLGRYTGAIRRQAAEIRAQFDAAMREAELDAMKKEVETMQTSVNAEVMGATKSLEEAVSTVSAAPARPNPLVPGASLPQPSGPPPKAVFASEAPAEAGLPKTGA